MDFQKLGFQPKCDLVNKIAKTIFWQVGFRFTLILGSLILSLCLSACHPKRLSFTLVFNATSQALIIKFCFSTKQDRLLKLVQGTVSLFLVFLVFFLFFKLQRLRISIFGPSLGSNSCLG